MDSEQKKEDETKTDKEKTNNLSAAHEANEEEEEDILLIIKNLDTRIQANEEELKKLLKKKKKANSIKKLSFNDYMFVDPLQYPKSLITIEHPLDASNGKIENKKQISFDSQSSFSLESLNENNTTIPTTPNTNDKFKNDDTISEINTSCSSLPYIIPIKESNTSLNTEPNYPDEENGEENTEKIDETEKLTEEDNDYLEANDDCNELFLVGFPRLHDYPHKHLFQNQRYRDKQRYLKILKEKRDYRNGKKNLHQKFVQTQNRTNIKLKKNIPSKRKRKRRRNPPTEIFILSFEIFSFNK
jgi:hypothetical protein